jgi:hypothetical protein
VRAQPAAVIAARGPRVALLGALALVSLGMEVNNYSSAYRDVPPILAEAVVRTGPYLGLHGSRFNVVVAEELTRELRARVTPGERMLAYYTMPAGYLFAGARPALPTALTEAYATVPVLLPYYQRHRTGRGLVLVVSRRSGSWRELEALIEQPARLIKDGGWYRLYREPPP